MAVSVIFAMVLLFAFWDLPCAECISLAVASTVTSGAVLGYSYVTSEGREIVTTVTSGAAGAFGKHFISKICNSPCFCSDWILPPPSETVTSDGSRYFGTVTSGAEGVFSTATSGAASVATVVTSGAGGALTTLTSAVKTDGAATLMPMGDGQWLGLTALVLAGIAGMGAVAL